MVIERGYRWAGRIVSVSRIQHLSNVKLGVESSVRDAGGRRSGISDHVCREDRCVLKRGCKFNRYIGMTILDPNMVRIEDYTRVTATSVAYMEVSLPDQPDKVTSDSSVCRTSFRAAPSIRKRWDY